MSKRWVAWREAAAVFIASRIAIFALTYLGEAIIGNMRTHYTRNCFHSAKSSCLSLWYQYDVVHYVRIAHTGYNTSVTMTAFFPLWPAMIRLVGLPFAYSLNRYVFISMVLANLLFYLALVVFYYLIYELLHDERVARDALFYLAFAPYALFFFAGYTESLFLFLCLCCFFCLQRALQTGRPIYWLLAGGAGLLASLSRSQGVFLVVPYFLVFVQRYLWPWPRPEQFAKWRLLFRYENWRRRFVQTTWRAKVMALVPICFIPLGVGIYMLYLWHTKGNPTEFSIAELKWDRHFAMPWVSISTAINALSVENSFQVRNALNLAGIIVPFLILILGWRRLPLFYNLFALVLLIFPLFYPTTATDALASLPRYMTIIFPLYIILATVKSPRFSRGCLALMTTLFALNCVLFTLSYWVA